MLVPLSFTLFTLPYAIISLKYKRGVSFIPNLLLVSSSGFNSLIYFFIDFCKRRNRRNTVAPVNGNPANPTEQPSRPRQEVDDKPTQSSSNASKRENNLRNQVGIEIPSHQSDENQQKSTSTQKPNDKPTQSSSNAGKRENNRRNQLGVAIPSHQPDENQQVLDAKLTKSSSNGCKRGIRKNKVGVSVPIESQQI